MRVSRTNGAVLLVLVTVGACTGGSKREAMPDSTGMSAAREAGPALTARPMLPAFRAHVDSLAAHPSMMRTSMASHEAEVKAVVDAMHADMMAAGMHSDPGYEALADSVVRGSAALGTASGPDFDRLVAEHVDQMRRLAAVYETKTAGM